MTKRVLVTGSSRGIGKAIAFDLAKDGFTVVLHCRTRLDQAQETAEKISQFGTSPSILRFDIGDRSKCQQAISEDIAENGAYYGAVLSAGMTSDAPFPGMSAEGWDNVIRTNLDGFYNVLHPIVMPMVQAKMGGRIVALSSLAGLVGNRGQTNYSASKAGIIAAAKSLAQELAKRKITVNCVAPGLIETEMTEELPKQEIIKSIPMRRFGTPEEVSGAVSFLFSERASYITAQVISVNGGML